NRIVPENRRASVPIEQALPLRLLRRRTGETVSGEPGEFDAGTEKVMHLILVPPGIGLQVIHALIDLIPVAPVVRSRNLRAGDGSQRARIDFSNHVARQTE